MEGSGNRVSLYVGALHTERGGRAPLLGTLKDIYRKDLETGVFLHRGPTEGP